MRRRTDPALIDEVFAEMKHRALQGCNGAHDFICCDSEAELHPEDWCNRCLMGLAVRAEEERKVQP